MARLPKPITPDTSSDSESDVSDKKSRKETADSANSQQGLQKGTPAPESPSGTEERVLTDAKIPKPGTQGSVTEITASVQAPEAPEAPAPVLVTTPITEAQQGTSALTTELTTASGTSSLPSLPGTKDLESRNATSGSSSLPSLPGTAETANLQQVIFDSRLNTAPPVLVKTPRTEAQQASPQQTALTTSSGATPDSWDARHYDLGRQLGHIVENPHLYSEALEPNSLRTSALTTASGAAASGTAASGTAASGTAASGTAASGTAASGTAASQEISHSQVSDNNDYSRVSKDELIQEIRVKSVKEYVDKILDKGELKFIKKYIKSYKNFEDLFSNNKEFDNDDNKKLYYYGKGSTRLSKNKDLIMKCAAYFYNNKMIIASRLDSSTDTGTKTGGVGNYPPYTNYTGSPLQEKLLKGKKAVEEKLLKGKKEVKIFKDFIEKFDNPVYNKINESSLNDNFKETINNALKKNYTSLDKTIYIEYYVYDLPYDIDENINKSIYKFTVRFRGIYNPENKYLYYLKFIEDKEVSYVKHLDNGYLDEEEIEQPEYSKQGIEDLESRNATSGTSSLPSLPGTAETANSQQVIFDSRLNTALPVLVKTPRTEAQHESPPQTSLLQETENTKNIILLRDLIHTLVSLDDDDLKTFFNYKINKRYGGNKILKTKNNKTDNIYIQR